MQRVVVESLEISIIALYVLQATGTQKPRIIILGAPCHKPLLSCLTFLGCQRLLDLFCYRLLEDDIDGNIGILSPVMKFVPPPPLAKVSSPFLKRKTNIRERESNIY